MNKPFIGAMNRKITIIEKVIGRTSTGSEKTTARTTQGRFWWSE